MNAPLNPAESAVLAALANYADEAWNERIVPALTEYIGVPAKSPMFDADWQQHGFLDRVVRDAAAWVEGRKLPGLKLEVIRLDGRTPVIFFDWPASGRGASADEGKTVLLYGHLDKQPAQRPRPLDTQARRRSALRPRWRRRRLRGVRRHHGAGGPARQRTAAPALCGCDRKLRRKWLG
jgi:hypothetical protein